MPFWLVNFISVSWQMRVLSQNHRTSRDWRTDFKWKLLILKNESWRQLSSQMFHVFSLPVWSFHFTAQFTICFRRQFPMSSHAISLTVLSFWSRISLWWAHWKQSVHDLRHILWVISFAKRLFGGEHFNFMNNFMKCAFRKRNFKEKFMMTTWQSYLTISTEPSRIINIP